MPAMADSQLGLLMPGQSWRVLIAKKRQRATFRITLIVRGKKIVKEYKSEVDFQKWKEAYEHNQKYQGSGIESVTSEVIYP